MGFNRGIEAERVDRSVRRMEEDSKLILSASLVFGRPPDYFLVVSLSCRVN
ncbi:MAG: hypothetical protein WAJ93_08405 [Candidatus Nitrosopolaris sp.]|jgi:hypothetical protein